MTIQLIINFPVSGVEHGKPGTYGNHGCRCDACRAAKHEYDQVRYQANREAVGRYKRKYRLKKFYGISVEDYDAMLEKQDGGCAICGRTESDETGRRLHVDHDHGTGELRGLLCNACNRGIGYFGDDIDRMEAAILYLGRQP